MEYYRVLARDLGDSACDSGYAFHNVVIVEYNCNVMSSATFSIAPLLCEVASILTTNSQTISQDVQLKPNTRIAGIPRSTRRIRLARLLSCSHESLDNHTMICNLPPHEGPLRAHTANFDNQFSTRAHVPVHHQLIPATTSTRRHP